MLENYLLIHKSILPEYYEKVLEARRLIEDGKAKEVSQAVKMVGISRSTYYKYKDYIMQPSEMTVGHKAVLSMMLTHEPGVLSTVLTRISEAGGSVLAIAQSLPILGRASVTLSLDVSSMGIKLPELLEIMEKTPGVEKPKLLAVE